MRLALIGSAFNRTNPTALPPELLAVLQPDTEARIYVPNVSAFPRNHLDLKFQEVGFIEAGLRAAKDGCDAIMLNTVGDYGLEALKSAVRVPVVGAGEAGIFQAAMLGRPFAIVTIWPKATEFLYRRLLTDSGLASQCAQVSFVGSTDELDQIGKADDDYIAKMQRGDSQVFDRIVASCRSAMEDHGATSILLGCTCMSPIAAKVAAALDVPVINPMTNAAKQVELLVRLGLAHSVASFEPATVPRDAAFAAMAETSAFHVAIEPCDACLVLSTH